MKIDLLYFSRVGVEKLSRDVEWAAKFFVRALSGPRKIFPEKAVFLRGPPPVINNDRSLMLNGDSSSAMTIKDLSYEERHGALKLSSLKYRRLRGRPGFSLK